MVEARQGREGRGAGKKEEKYWEGRERGMRGVDSERGRHSRSEGEQNRREGRK